MSGSKLRQFGCEADVKGIVVETAGAVSLDGSSVNVRTWAIETMGSQRCQSGVDAKAFTGRGGLSELRHQVDLLDRIEARMAELSKLSKTGGLLDVYLMLHRRARTGYAFLRWREVGGGKRHLSWDALDDRAFEWDSRTKQWLAQMTAQAQQLNEEHLVVRDELARIRRRVMALAQPVFARSVL